MPRKPAATVTPDPVEETPSTDGELPYHLEPMDEELQSRLNVWGNSTVMLLSQIGGRYPEWARMIEDMKDTLGLVIKGAAE